ncbi:MAG: SPOR domain-containing protein [Spirochaetia bacterium]
MENSKTLIVIVSVSLFVAAVLGLGLVLFYPREAPQVAGGGAQSGSAGSFDAIEYLRDPDAERPSLETTEEDEDSEEEDDGDVVIVYGEAVEERPDEERDREEARETAPERAEEPDTAPSERAPAAEAERPAERAPEPETVQPARTAPRRAPEPPTREVQVTEYWIQVIATTSRDRVDMARKRLREHELSGRITTKVVDGRTFYRLRVGPYTNKNEAAKFLDWVNDIEGFADSYISEEYSTRTVQG